MPSLMDVLLIDFILPLVATVLVTWLWTTYDASDFVVQRSASSIQERIMYLEEWLSNIEAIYADLKRYTTRIITLATIIIMYWISMMNIII